MAQTTTAINACDAVIMLDNELGVPVDISGSTNNVDLDLTNELGMAHTFGSRYPFRLECKSDANIAMRALYTETDTEATRQWLRWYFVDRGSKTLTIAVPDASGGGDLFTFEVLLESLKIPLDGTAAAPIPVEAVLKPTGVFGVTAIAS